MFQISYRLQLRLKKFAALMILLNILPAGAALFVFVVVQPSVQIQPIDAYLFTLVVTCLAAFAGWLINVATDWLAE